MGTKLEMCPGWRHMVVIASEVSPEQAVLGRRLPSPDILDSPRCQQLSASAFGLSSRPFQIKGHKPTYPVQIK